MESMDLDIKKEFQELFDIVHNDKINNCQICKMNQCNCSTIDSSLEKRNSDNFSSTKHDYLSSQLLEDHDPQKNLQSTEKILMPLGCRICEEKFYRLTPYERHWKINHQNVNPAEMFINGLHCELCDRYFPSLKSLRAHTSSTRETAHTKLTKKRKLAVAKDHRYCPVCGIIVNDFCELESHLDIVHGGLRIENEIQTNVSITPSIITSQPQQLFDTDELSNKLLRSPQSNFIGNMSQPPPTTNITSMPKQSQSKYIFTQHLPREINLFATMPQLPLQTDIFSAMPQSPPQDNHVTTSLIPHATKPQIPPIIDLTDSEPKQPQHTSNMASVSQINNSAGIEKKVRKSILCPKCGLVCKDEKAKSDHVSSCAKIINRDESMISTMEPAKIRPLLPKSTCSLTSSTEDVINTLQPYEVYQLIPSNSEEFSVVPQTDMFHNNDGFAATSLHSQLTHVEGYETFHQHKRIDGHLFDVNDDGNATRNESCIDGCARLDKVENSASSKVFKCTVCLSITPTARSRKNHYIQHHNYKACSFCDFASPNSLELFEHNKGSHELCLPRNTVEVTDNSLCTKGRISQKDKTYSKKEHKTIYCRVCGKGYSHNLDYRQHFTKYHSEYSLDDMYDVGYKCSLCSIVFPSVKSLQTHWTIQHKGSYRKEMFFLTEKDRVYKYHADSDWKRPVHF